MKERITFTCKSGGTTCSLWYGLDKPPFADALMFWKIKVLFIYLRDMHPEKRNCGQTDSFLFTDLRFGGLLDEYCSIKDCQVLFSISHFFIIVPCVQ